MLGRLVQTNTIDGVRLHGFMSEPAQLLNAWILVHGVNSNFYSSELLNDLSRSLARDDTAILIVNTRGHDILSFNSGATPMRLGSQIENISASQLDLDAWAQFLSKEGVQRFSLLGHSLGALKCIQWGLKNDERLQALVAVSPPRLNTELLLQDPSRGPVFANHLRDATERCDSGHPESVMKVRFPLPMWVCASTYKDKYGSGEKYDYLMMANQLRVPTLWTFGEYEVDNGSANFKQADLELQKHLSSADKANAKHTICVVPNADHSYRGVTSILANGIESWVRDLIGSTELG